ncbi:MAG: dockerin type I domain-containing protein, partial [Candidatus Micrarchaeota archaeon]
IDSNEGYLSELSHASDFAPLESNSADEQTLPSVSITSPITMVYPLGSRIKVDYSVQDASGLSGYVSLVDQILVGVKQVIDTGILAEGNHTFKVAALDGKGNEAVQKVTFELKRVDGDVNIDAKANLADALVVAGHYNANVTDENYDGWADLNNDGVINETDLDLVLQEVS